MKYLILLTLATLSLADDTTELPPWEGMPGGWIDVEVGPGDEGVQYALGLIREKQDKECEFVEFKKAQVQVVNGYNYNYVLVVDCDGEETTCEVGFTTSWDPSDMNYNSTKDPVCQ
ncbi:uncharacterized protein LOC131953415 [Physella acuta]|uniref:uncharacterized protein LOC131953415 n=1 Tax=Physella acuta TaxID=109671 RepID=UPI0027DB55DC|nr:uncharacterized protein LOC131953415 [Physella acuta]